MKYPKRPRSTHRRNVAGLVCLMARSIQERKKVGGYLQLSTFGTIDESQSAIEGVSILTEIRFIAVALNKLAVRNNDWTRERGWIHLPQEERYKVDSQDASNTNKERIAAGMMEEVEVLCILE